MSELIEKMNTVSLKQVLKKAKEYPPLQRLGYLFELLEESTFADIVAKHLGTQYLATVPLDTRNPSRQGEIHTRWRLLINTKLESDL